MHKYVVYLLTLLLFACQKEQVLIMNVAELSDGNPETFLTGNKNTKEIIFSNISLHPKQTYKISSCGESPRYDPSGWVLKGSYDGDTWIVLDEQKEQRFCARYQEVTCRINQPSNYIQYMLEVSTIDLDTFKIGEVTFLEKNLLSNWEDFDYPEVEFSVLNEGVGSDLYRQLVQDPVAYVKDHTQKVAEILYYSASDYMPEIKKIDYTLQEYEGISAKSGSPPLISIVYNPKYIERLGQESPYQLERETRGILYHALTYAYLFQPRGIGTYQTNREYKACVEGLADAVRTQAGLFDMSTRRPGGHWLDGYRTTGFFLHWLTGKDPDFIRKFNQTVRELEVWSFDAAIKRILGIHTGVEKEWNEYQMNISKKLLTESG